MGAAHSSDLRDRVVAEVAAGWSRRQAAARFRVSPSSAIRWAELKDGTGSVSPRPRGGKNRSPLAAHAAWLLELNAKEGDLTLAQIERRILAALGVATSEASIRRFFKRRRISFKKALRAAEQDRPDVAQARQSWQADQARLDPRRPSARFAGCPSGGSLRDGLRSWRDSCQRRKGDCAGVL